MQVFLIVAGMLVTLLSPARAEWIDSVDRAGRAVSVQLPAERFVIGEGRYIPLLALLRPENPMAGLVGTMSPLNHTEPAPVALDDTVGSIVFSIGICRVEAKPSALLLRCESPDAAALDQLQTVITDHVTRFGWREAPEIMWSSS